MEEGCIYKRRGHLANPPLTHAHTHTRTHKHNHTNTHSILSSQLPPPAACQIWSCHFTGTIFFTFSNHSMPPEVGSHRKASRALACPSRRLCESCCSAGAVALLLFLLLLLLVLLLLLLLAALSLPPVGKLDWPKKSLLMAASDLLLAAARRSFKLFASQSSMSRYPNSKRWSMVAASGGQIP